MPLCRLLGFTEYVNYVLVKDSFRSKWVKFVSALSSRSIISTDRTTSKEEGKVVDGFSNATLTCFLSFPNIKSKFIFLVSNYQTTQVLTEPLVCTILAFRDWKSDISAHAATFAIIMVPLLCIATISIASVPLFISTHILLPIATVLFITWTTTTLISIHVVFTWLLNLLYYWGLFLFLPISILVSLTLLNLPILPPQLSYHNCCFSFLLSTDVSHILLCPL